jgi:hypothetical protein
MVAKAGNRLVRVQFAQPCRYLGHGDGEHAKVRALFQLRPAQFIGLADIEYQGRVQRMRLTNGGQPCGEISGSDLCNHLWTGNALEVKLRMFGKTVQARRIGVPRRGAAQGSLAHAGYELCRHNGLVPHDGYKAAADSQQIQ